MTKFLLRLFVFVCTIYTIFAAVAIGLPNSKYRDRCFDGERTYRFGVHYPYNECVKIVCSSDTTLHFESCGSMSSPDGYENVPDLSKKYPECCKNIVKKEDIENTIE